jgi:XRE family transcriptional regulator, fatty acid utilization regulator
MVAMDGIDALTFGRRLRHYRKRAQLTLQELGEMVDRPAPYLSMLENGRREPKASHVRDLARALQVEVGDLLSEEAPTARAEMEIELERAQSDPRFERLALPYVRPSPSLSDEVLQHLVGLYRVLYTGPESGGAGDGIRPANAAVGNWLRSQDGYLSDVEAVANGVLEKVGHAGDGPLSSRTLLDIASHLGFRIEAVEDMLPGVRSVTDDLTGRLYIAQRNELRTRQARKAILQTLARRLLGHGEPADLGEFLRQRVETAYLAGAILVPEKAAVRRFARRWRHATSRSRT